jgi:bifunctional non-homologous end joining protein LigD
MAIAVLDEKGATRIGDLQDDIAQGRSDRLAYFAFDLLYLDGHGLRGWPLCWRGCFRRSIPRLSIS